MQNEVEPLPFTNNTVLEEAASLEIASSEGGPNQDGSPPPFNSFKPRQSAGEDGISVHDQMVIEAIEQANQNAPTIDVINYPVLSDQEESKSSSQTAATAVATLQVPEPGIRSHSNQSSVSKANMRSILEEESERISNCDPDEEAKETEYCIKGYDYNNRSTYNQYTLVSCLADSMYTNISICQKNNTFERLVMKQLRRGLMRKHDRTAYIDAMREIDIHKMLIHPNIVQLFEVIDDATDDKVYLIMQNAEQGRIMQHNRETNTFMFKGMPDYDLPEPEIRKYTRQILRALVYLHKKKIMHLDIKPQNILLDENSCVKIADFGTSQIFYQDEMDQILSHRGTFEFMAPECYKQGNKTACYSGRKADVWAFGLVVYALAFNDLPFTMGQGIETRYAHQNMREQDLCFAQQARRVPISNGLKDFLRKALAHEPAERASVFQLAEHAWLTSNDWF